MNVSTMRKIDYYVGIPLCFIISIFFTLSRLFRTKKSTRNVSNVLFIELSEMGSAILADPAMRKIAREKSAKLHFVIFKKNAKSLHTLATVKEDDIFTLRDTGIIPLAIDTLRFLFWCRKRKIDTTIDFELFSRFTALLTGLSGARNRVGFHAFCNEGLYRGNMLSHKVTYNPHIHIAKNFIALVNSVLSDEEELPYSKRAISDEEIVLPKVAVSESDKEAMRHIIQSVYAPFNQANKVILVNAHSSELLPQRCWPADNFIEVIKKLVELDEKVLVLLTGTKKEAAYCDAICSAVGSDRCINFCGKDNYQNLPALFSLSTLMLSNDCGVAHLASLTDIPNFVLFGPETPTLYRPLGNCTPIYANLACSPCVSAWNHRETPCRNNVCMQAITPHTVFLQLTKQLSI